MHRHKLESGQGLAEYSFLYVLVALFLIIILAIFGQEISNTYFFLTETLRAVIG